MRHLAFLLRLGPPVVEVDYSRGMCAFLHTARNVILSSRYGCFCFYIAGVGKPQGASISSPLPLAVPTAGEAMRQVAQQAIFRISRRRK